MYKVSLWVLGFCIFVYAIGVVLMIAADCQKHFALLYNHQLAKEKKFLIP